MAELPPREGRADELWGGGPCQGPCLPLADALPLPQPCIIIHMNNAGIWFTPAKIYLVYTSENLYERKLSLDDVSPKT